MAKLRHQLTHSVITEKSATETNAIRRPHYRTVAWLFGVSLALHFLFLSHPAQVVFDEFYYGTTTHHYLVTSEHHFNSHPPAGKLLIAGVTKLLGYSGNGSFTKIGEANSPRDFFAMRVAPAVAGTLLPLVVYALLFSFGASHLAAFLGAFAVLFDNATLVQSRTIALDAILMLFMFSSVLFCQWATQAATHTRKTSLLIASGLCLGMAAGTKFTGLSILPVLFYLLLSPTPNSTFKGKALALARAAGQLSFTSVFAGAIFLLCVKIHFSLLPKLGDAIKFFPIKNQFWPDFLAYQTSLFSANRTMTATHPSASPWWGWPFDTAAVYLWINGTARMYLVINPIVALATTLTLISLAYCSWMGALKLIELPTKTPQRALNACLIGFVASWLPYAAIPRVMFLYHYLPALLFAVMAGALWLETLGVMNFEKPTRWARFSRRRNYQLMLAMIVAGFLIFSPITFGLTVNDDYFQWLSKLWIKWH